MEDTIIIKKESGKTISVTARQGENGIILTKTGDKSEISSQRKIVIEAMDLDIYKKFVDTEISTNNVSRFLDYIKELIIK